MAECLAIAVIAAIARYSLCMNLVIKKTRQDFQE